MEGGQERKQSEEYIRHKHGRAEFSQRLECMVELRNNKCIVYHKKGLEIEICSAKRIICSITENATKGR